MNQRKELELSQWRAEAELNLLAGILWHARRDSDLAEDVLSIFKPEMWIEPKCQITARAIRRMVDDGEEAHLDLVCARVLSEICGASIWLAEIFERGESFIGPSTVRHAAEKLFCEHVKAQSVLSISEAMRVAKDPGYDLATLQDVIAGCLAGIENSETPRAMTNQIDEYFAQLEAGESPVIRTPWDGLNYALAGGVSPGELVVIGARPSVGKSAFAVNWLWNVAACGGNTVFFSLEMSRREVFNRIAAKLAQVNLREFRGKMSAALLAKIQDEALQRMNGKGLFVDERGQITPAEMRRVCKAQAKKKALSLVVIDYLQLVTPDEKQGNREQEVSSISRKCKLLAKDLNVPVLLLAQLNREIEKQNREPKLSDLRESGAIEQDADTIMFLHQDKRDAGRCQAKGFPEPLKVIVAKGRNTGTGFTSLVYNKAIQNISDMDDEFKARMEIMVRGHSTFADNGL